MMRGFYYSTEFIGWKYEVEYIENCKFILITKFWFGSLLFSDPETEFCILAMQIF